MLQKFSSFDANAFQAGLRSWIGLFASLGAFVAFFGEITLDHFQHMQPVATVCVAILTARAFADSRSFRLDIDSKNPRIPTLRILIGPDAKEPSHSPEPSEPRPLPSEFERPTGPHSRSSDA